MATPLKVLYLTPAAKDGRSLAAPGSSFVEEEIRAIRDCNVEPLVLTDAIETRVRIDGIELIGVPRGRVASLPRSTLFGLRHAGILNKVFRAAAHGGRVIHAVRVEEAAARVVVEQRVDIIHSHFGAPAGFGGSLAARAAGVPLVASIRGADILVRPDLGYGFRLDPAYDTALRHLLESASVVLTATSFMRQRTLDLGAPPERVQILEKGVDTIRFRPPADREQMKTSLGLSGPVLLAVGTLMRRKGFDVIIEALASLRHTATLVICGQGDEQNALAGLAAARGVTERVRFAGQISRAQMHDYFAAADLFIHAAELEAAGNVVLEALASECAAVVTDSGGPSEYVEDGVNGFVVPVADPATLAARIDALLSDPSLRRAFAAEGRRRVEARHTYPRMMTDLRAIYDDVRQRHSTRRRAS